MKLNPEQRRRAQALVDSPAFDEPDDVAFELIWLRDEVARLGRAVAAGAGDPKWVRFDSTGPSESGKTQTWRVVTRDGDGNLGRVAWFGRWRRYAFFPFDATVFEHQCLRDIAAFCEQQTAAQRAAKVSA